VQSALLKTPEVVNRPEVVASEIGSVGGDATSGKFYDVAGVVHSHQKVTFQLESAV
jgi:hypothetical protein